MADASSSSIIYIIFYSDSKVDVTIGGYLNLPYNSYQNFPEGSCIKAFVTNQPCTEMSCFSRSLAYVVLKNFIVRDNRVKYNLKFNGEPGTYYVK